MLVRRVVLFVFAAVSVVLLSPVVAGAQEASSSEGEKSAATQVEAFETGRFVVRFGKQAPLARAVPQPWEERGALVVKTLQDAAAVAQSRAVELVESDPDASYESHWITNALVVSGSPELIARLEQLSGVTDVQPEMSRPILAPVRREPAVEAATIDAPWGIEKVRAPEAWATGVLGGGVVVASLDSGVQYDHPALVEQYRGNLGGGSFDHNYNWFDASRTCADPAVPCDDFGHGTHTMGTMVGGDGPGPFTPDVGMAPAAEWITVSCGPFFCSDGQLMEAGEWFLAPTDLTGENPDPARRPDIVNNSWGFGPGDTIFLDFVQAWRAAGIVPVFAAGNPGPFCGAGGSPGDYLEAISVGATDSEDVIAEFSGRGPSVFGKINPNVSAPGVFVLSSVPGDGFEFFDGTSMAAPHVVGALALMMSADPALKGDVDGVTALLASTATDIIDDSCGGDADGDPNNVYGDGRIDAAAAVAIVASGGTITGTVTNTDTGAPLAGATVTATAAAWESQTFTDSSGRYRLFVPADTYVVIAETFGFEAAIATGVVVETDATTTQDLSLEPLPTRTLSGVVRTAESREIIAGAVVEAVGTPVAPVRTDDRGRFSLVLPIGTYTINASSGGCVLPQSTDVDLVRNRQIQLRLPTKIDNFGHGCRPIGFEWIEADIQSGVYGDDLAGRLDLPFSFPFYTETYDRLFFTTNGYVNFLDDFGFSGPFNTAIPSPELPNAAIYALWQDLVVDDASRIDYASLEVGGRSVFVIEWENIAQLGTDNRLDMEVKLWEDGTIDLLYGDGVDQLTGGSQATIGLENADASDGFQFSFRKSILESNTAWRFEKVPTGVLTGVVTNANDRLPVAGATISTTPGDRTTLTDENGEYRLQLVPGRYQVDVSAPNYQSATLRPTIRDGGVTTRDFALQAAAAAIAPLEVTAAVDLGQTTEVTVTVSNTGRAPLEWELKERQDSVTPPVLEPPPPVAPTAETLRRNAEWARPDFGTRVARAVTAAETLFVGPLAPIIDDPLGDASGSVDIATILGGSDGAEASFQIDFSDGTPMNELGGYLFLDTDQDPTTGLSAEGLSGLPTQDVGMEYFIDFFSSSSGEVLVIDAITFEFVASLPANISGKSLSFDVPLETLGGDDGAMNLAAVLGDFNGPTDWAPDAGHGELFTFRDTNWMTPDPSSGSTPARRTTEVTLTLGGSDVAAGSYTGSLTLVSNDPRQPQIPISVNLDVALPADFGTVVGTVTDLRSSQPIPAEVTITAERNGASFVVTTTAEADGSYSMSAPEGAWPISVVSEDYVAFDGEVTVVAGSETTFDVSLSAGGPQIVISAEEFLDFELPPGGTESRPLNIANTGTADVEFDIIERPVSGPPLALTSPTGEDGSRYIWDPDERLEITDRIRSQVVTGIGTAATLDVIITDPPDDALRSAEIEAIRAGSEAGVITFAVDFGEVTVLEEIFGLMLLDVDQNPNTGLPAPELGGLETQEVGVEYFLDMFVPEGVAALISIDTGDVIAFLEMRIEGRSLIVDLPLELLPGEDGAMDVAANFGDFDGQSDWAPDEGKGRINPPEVPWLTFDPTSGVVAPGTDVDVTVAADATGLEPGTYNAELVVTSNDPLLPSFPVPVSLTVPSGG